MMANIIVIKAIHMLTAKNMKLGTIPRYRPWITASSLLLFSDDVMDGETAAQGYLCKSGCQVEHISRERSRVKPQPGKNLPEINKLLIKRLLFAHLGQ
ncbi:hypothetical protein ACET8R_00060 [Aeromonas veronii]